MKSNLASAEEAAEARSTKRRRLNDPHQQIYSFQDSNHDPLQRPPYSDAQYDVNTTLPEESDEKSERDPESPSSWLDESRVVVEDCPGLQECCYGMVS